MLENSKHKCTNAVNNVQPIKNSSHTAKFFQYITDCRPEITKTVMGTREGKSTYSVYPCNASIKHTKTIYFSARTLMNVSVRKYTLLGSLKACLVLVDSLKTKVRVCWFCTAAY